MVMGRTIQIRLKKDQYERIKDISMQKGFNSLSSYLRYMALHQDFITQQKVAEIHTHLLGNQANKKFKKIKA